LFVGGGVGRGGDDEPVDAAVLGLSNAEDSELAVWGPGLDTDLLADRDNRSGSATSGASLFRNSAFEVEGVGECFERLLESYVEIAGSEFEWLKSPDGRFLDDGVKETGDVEVDSGVVKE